MSPIHGKERELLMMLESSWHCAPIFWASLLSGRAHHGYEENSHLYNLWLQMSFGFWSPSPRTRVFHEWQYPSHLLGPTTIDLRMKKAQPLFFSDSLLYYFCGLTSESRGLHLNWSLDDVLNNKIVSSLSMPLILHHWKPLLGIVSTAC